MVRLEDIQGGFEASFVVGLVLAVQHVLHERHQLANTLIVQHVQALVLRES